MATINPDQRVHLVTGATSGIGFAAARALASIGDHVVLVGRNPDRGARALEAVGKLGSADLLLADLSSQADVRRLAIDIRSRYSRLNSIVHNAGAVFGRRERTVDGVEMTLALNHLAPFLLTHELWDTIVASQTRVITVSSDAHYVATVNPAALNGSGFYLGWWAYAQSKLLNILFTAELARRLDGTGATANSVHPGIVATRIAANNGGLHGLLPIVFNLIGISPDQGARTLVYLAASPDVAGQSGGYWVDCRPATPAPLARNAGLAADVWERSLALIAPAPLHA